MDVDLLCHLLEAGATCARVDLSVSSTTKSFFLASNSIATARNKQ